MHRPSLKKGCDVFVEKFFIRGTGARPRGMSPQRRDRLQGTVRNHWRFVASIGYREIEVGRRRHVEHLRLYGSQRLSQVPMETRGGTDVMLFPCAHLQD